MRTPVARLVVLVALATFSCLFSDKTAWTSNGDYTVIDLGTLGPNDTYYSIARGINQRGVAAGESATSSAVHPFLSTRTGILTWGCPRERHRRRQQISTIWAKSLARSTARRRNLTVSSMALVSSAIWACCLAAHQRRLSESISTAGQSAWLTMRLTRTGRSYTRMGKCRNLGALGTGTMSEARSINARGQVVGHSTFSDVGTRHAFLYSNGALTDLGVASGFTNSRAFDINDLGVIAGTLSTDPLYAAAVYSRGAWKSLGSVTGYDGSTASAINDLGQVVGSLLCGSTPCHGFVYKNGRMTDLNALLPSGSGWEIAEALDVNDTGEITGLGYVNGSQIPHAFILKPVHR